MAVGSTGARIAGVAQAYPVKCLTFSENSLLPTQSFFKAGGTVSVKYQLSQGATAQSYNTTLSKKYAIRENRVVRVVPYSLHCLIDGQHLVDRDGKLYRNTGGMTEDPEIVGSVDYVNKVLTLTHDDFTSAAANLSAQITHASGVQVGDPVYSITFRTPGAPVRPGSLQIKGTLVDGSIITGSADNDGMIDNENMQGFINANTGYGWVEFGRWVDDDTESQQEPWYNADNIEGAFVWQPYAIEWQTVLLNCVVTSYLPLDESLLGLNPVRLPIDGKVPIYRDGDIILIHNTQAVTMPDPLLAGQVVPMGRGDLSLVELHDQDGTYVPTTYFTADLAAGTVTMSNPLDLSGFTEPLVATHRQEDMVLAADVQITGHIGIVSQLTHDYTAGESFISSVLPVGDLQSRAFNEFEQEAWSGDWSDELIGDAPLASYDFVNYPIQVNNKNSVEERFAIIFTSSTNVQVVGENLGIILTTSITSDISPINPNTGEPYFTMVASGWGSGWSAGNVVRFNMSGANYPLWFARTTLQGPAEESSDQYTAQIRGDSN